MWSLWKAHFHSSRGFFSFFSLSRLVGFPRFVSRFDLRQLRQGQYPGAVIDFYIVRDTTWPDTTTYYNSTLPTCLMIAPKPLTPLRNPSVRTNLFITVEQCVLGKGPHSSPDPPQASPKR